MFKRSIPLSDEMKKMIQTSTNKYIEKCKKNENIVYVRYKQTINSLDTNLYFNI